MSKRKKIILSPGQQVKVRAATIAHKQLLAYIKEHSITPEDYNTPPHKDKIEEWVGIIRVGRKISENATYEFFEKLIKVPKHKTKDGLGKSAQRRAKLKQEAEYQAKSFKYPDLGRPLEPAEENLYKNIYIKNLNSGMSREKAETVSLNTFIGAIAKR